LAPPPLRAIPAEITRGEGIAERLRIDETLQSIVIKCSKIAASPVRMLCLARPGRDRRFPLTVSGADIPKLKRNGFSMDTVHSFGTSG
jgi:hypothetical protein